METCLTKLILKPEIRNNIALVVAGVLLGTWGLGAPPAILQRLPYPLLSNIRVI
jgi:hypothetical protein